MGGSYGPENYSLVCYTFVSLNIYLFLRILLLIIGIIVFSPLYLQCGRSFDPRFLYTWPTARVAMDTPENLAEKSVTQVSVGKGGIGLCVSLVCVGFVWFRLLCLSVCLSVCLHLCVGFVFFILFFSLRLCVVFVFWRVFGFYCFLLLLRGGSKWLQSLSAKINYFTITDQFLAVIG